MSGEAFWDRTFEEARREGYATPAERRQAREEEATTRVGDKVVCKQAGGEPFAVVDEVYTVLDIRSGEIKYRNSRGSVDWWPLCHFVKVKVTPYN